MKRLVLMCAVCVMMLMPAFAADWGRLDVRSAGRSTVTAGDPNANPLADPSGSFSTDMLQLSGTFGLLADDLMGAGLSVRHQVGLFYYGGGFISDWLPQSSIEEIGILDPNFKYYDFRFALNAGTVLLDRVVLNFTPGMYMQQIGEHTPKLGNIEGLNLEFAGGLKVIATEYLSFGASVAYPMGEAVKVRFGAAFSYLDIISIAQAQANPDAGVVGKGFMEQRGGGYGGSAGGPRGATGIDGGDPSSAAASTFIPETEEERLAREEKERLAREEKARKEEEKREKARKEAEARAAIASQSIRHYITSRALVVGLDGMYESDLGVTDLMLGAEWRILEPVAVRGGLRYNVYYNTFGWSAGFSVWVSMFTIDAGVQYSGLFPTAMLALRWTL